MSRGAGAGTGPGLRAAGKEGLPAAPLGWKKTPESPQAWFIQLQARVLNVTQGPAELLASASGLRGTGPIYVPRVLRFGLSLELWELSRVCWGRL